MAKENQVVLPKQRGGNLRGVKMSREIVDCVIRMLENHCLLKSKEMKRNLKEDLEVEILTSTIARHLENELFTVKKKYH